MISDTSVEEILTEFNVITREIIVEKEGDLNLTDESNQFMFFAGILVAFLIMGIVMLFMCLFWRKRTKTNGKIIIR